MAYQRMAAAAPHLPGGKIASAFSERLVPHYLVGLLAHVTGLSLHASYRIGALLCIAATLLFAERVFATFRPPWWAYALGLTAFVLAPYSGLRQVILAPGSLQDLVFVLGVALTLLGLLRVRFSLVLAGLVVALLGRQTALLFGLAAVLWIFLSPDWKKLAFRRRLGEGIAALVTLAGLYAVIMAVTASFSFHFAPDSPSDTILFGPPGTHELLAHVVRCFDPILVPGVALMATLLILVHAGLRFRELPMNLWLCILLSAAIVIQPLLIKPGFPGFSHNEQRLVGLGLLPLCAALAIALAEADRRRIIAPTPALVGGGLGVLFITSLHHIYTVIGPSNVDQYVVLQVLGALLLAGGVVYARLKAPAQPLAAA